MGGETKHHITNLSPLHKPPPQPRLIKTNTPSPSAHETWKHLTTIAEVLTPTSTNRADFLQECRSGAFDNIKAAYRTFSSASITGPWDQELIAALPLTLEFVAHNGAGYDQIDISSCSARSPPLRVSNVPTAVDDATADAAVFLMLGALRNFNAPMFALRRGEWKGARAPELGRDPQGKVLGILGMGGIGRNFARKARGLGMDVIYHNRSRVEGLEEGEAEWVGFEELLARADVLSLNLPLNVSSFIFGFVSLGREKRPTYLLFVFRTETSNRTRAYSMISRPKS